MVAHPPPWQESSKGSESVCRRKTLLYNDFSDMIAIQAGFTRASDRDWSSLEHHAVTSKGLRPCGTRRLRNRLMVLT